MVVSLTDGFSSHLAPTCFRVTTATAELTNHVNFVRRGCFVVDFIIWKISVDVIKGVLPFR